MRNRHRQQRQALRDQFRLQHVGVPHQRPDADRRAAIVDAAERFDPVDVDQHPGRRQPHVERRHQALAAGQHLRVAGVVAQQRHRLVDIARTPIKKRTGLHRREPRYRGQPDTNAVTIAGIMKISAIISMVSQT